MCFVIHKTTSKLQRVILTTMYLVGAKNTDKNSPTLVVGNGSNKLKMGESLTPWTSF
jgi:hypothetical protein